MKEYKLTGTLQLRSDVVKSERPRIAIRDGLVINSLDFWIERNGLKDKKVELIIRVLE